MEYDVLNFELSPERLLYLLDAKKAVFKPALYKNAVLYPLPRPVLSVRFQDAWDAEQFKVPLKDGDFMTGHSQQGVEILVEGQVGTQSGDWDSSEEDRLPLLEDLQDKLDVNSDGEKYTFFLLHDAVTPTYRKFKSCSTVRFDYDLSDKSLYKYSIAIHADDPLLYTTAPGA